VNRLVFLLARFSEYSCAFHESLETPIAASMSVKGGFSNRNRVVLTNPCAAIVGFAPACVKECALCAALA